MNKAKIAVRIAERSGVDKQDCIKVLNEFEKIFGEELSAKRWKRTTFKTVYKLMTLVRGMVVLFLLLIAGNISGQNSTAGLTQSIRGVVTDEASGIPVAYATIILLNKPDMGTVTDDAGHFNLKNVPVGRHDVKVAFLGYEPSIFREILVTSSKEVYLEIPLKESIQALDEVVVRPQVNKEQPLNKMATTGARMLSVEEAGRYAGGMDDPARLVSSFAGVSSSMSKNSISVHGNAPHLLQWKLEDVEIPNPNHFADISTLGGGILSSLSSMVLGNSDFFTGSFPAEYNNAVSGVFDMKLRNGNNRKNENTFQAGILGIDVASEGPLSKKHNSSYIINYRYSATGLMSSLGITDVGGTLDYQDLNFKLNFPTRKAGVFSIWGTSLFDKFKSDFEEDTTLWEYTDDMKKSDFQQKMVAGGLSHRYFFNNGGLLKTTLATTFFQHEGTERYFDEELNSTPYMDLKRNNTNLVLTSYFNRKFTARFTNKTGFTFTRMFYDMNMDIAPYKAMPLQNIAKGDGGTNLISGYTSSAVGLSDQVTLNFGVNAQIFTLNKHWTVEPRAGVKWQASSKTSFALAYGLHSRMEKMDVYFVKTPRTGDEWVNKELDFTKAHHLMLSYAWRISDNMNLKIEPYFQYLFDVPVMKDGSYSILNRSDFYVEDPLVNEGKGQNMGVDLTLEKYLNKGLYYMISASVFNSEYCGGDGIWHDTKFNRSYIVNLLGGKEWMLGRNNQNILGINLKLTWQGGDRYSPVDREATMEQPDREVVYDETRAYSEQFSPMFIGNYTVSYKMNRRKVAHEFAVKGVNATKCKEYYSHQYNLKKETIDPNRVPTSLINVSYKLEF